MKYYCTIDAENKIISYAFDKFTEGIEIEAENEPNLNYDKIINGYFIRATEEDIQKYNLFLKAQKTQRENVAFLKVELNKIKEDIEQVDLFGMTRSDTAQKRVRAAEIVNELRALEEKLFKRN